MYGASKNEGAGMSAMDIIRECAREQGLTVNEMREQRYTRRVVDAVVASIIRLKAAGVSQGRMALLLNRSEKVIYKYTKSIREGKAGKRRPRKGVPIYVRGSYLPRLEEYARLTETTIPALVNKAVSDMLESA